MKLKFFSILILLLFCSCDKPTEPNKTDFTNFRYPLEVGSKWVYYKEVQLLNISADSINAFEYFPNSTVSVEVLALDTLSTATPSYEMIGITIDSVAQMYPDTSRFYYNNTDTGLIQYAGYGFNSIVPVSGHSILEKFINQKYKIIGQRAAPEDSRVAIKYPVKFNETWKYTNIEYLFSISKKISGYENISTFSGMRPCFVVEWLYTGLDAHITDYFSDLGLMKRIVSIKNVNIDYSESNPGSSFNADVVETYTLVSFER